MSHREEFWFVRCCLSLYFVAAVVADTFPVAWWFLCSVMPLLDSFLCVTVLQFKWFLPDVSVAVSTANVWYDRRWQNSWSDRSGGRGKWISGKAKNVPTSTSGHWHQTVGMSRL